MVRWMDVVLENTKNGRENLIKIKLFMNLFKPTSYVGLELTRGYAAL